MLHGQCSDRDLCSPALYIVISCSKICICIFHFVGCNAPHQLLAYADNVNILGGSIHTLKENAEAFVAATRVIGLEVSADKTKYMVMSQDQNVG